MLFNPKLPRERHGKLEQVPRHLKYRIEIMLTCLIVFIIDWSTISSDQLVFPVLQWVFWTGFPTLPYI